jgi:hypothetical protein
MWYSEQLQWRLGSPSWKKYGPASTLVRAVPLASARETLELCLLDRPPSQELVPLLQLLAPRLTGRALPVAELWSVVQAERALGDQFDEFFRERKLSTELLESRVARAVAGVIGARLLN